MGNEGVIIWLIREYSLKIETGHYREKLDLFMDYYLLQFRGVGENVYILNWYDINHYYNFLDSE